MFTTASVASAEQIGPNDVRLLIVYEGDGQGLKEELVAHPADLADPDWLRRTAVTRLAQLNAATDVGKIPLGPIALDAPVPGPPTPEEQEQIDFLVAYRHLQALERGMNVGLTLDAGAVLATVQIALDKHPAWSELL